VKTLFPRILLAVALTGFGGCVEPDEEEECTPVPYHCDRTRPHDADLTIRVSSPLPEVVSIYAGTAYETGRLVWSGAPKGKEWSERLPLDDYSVTATYKRGSKTIIAVDGDYLDYESTDTCDGYCYDELDGAVNLELVD
jgi:hypothetical protein